MARPQPLILLPPSEGKSTGGDGPSWRVGTMADGSLDPHRRRVLTEAIRQGATARRAPTASAMQRYTGVLYRELDWGSLPVAARRRGAEQVRIVSGLWGLVAPDDPIPAYKLKMSARLGQLGRLSGWWKPRLSPVLTGMATGARVWDLLPIEHSAAMDWSACQPAQRITVRFVDVRGRTVSHWNKLLKGSLVRWLLTECPTDLDDLHRFDHPLGYRFDEDASSLDGMLATAVLREQS